MAGRRRGAAGPDAGEEVSEQVAGEGQVDPGVAAAVQGAQEDHDHHGTVWNMWRRSGRRVRYVCGFNV